MATHSVDTRGTMVGAELAGHTITEVLDRDSRRASFRAHASDGTEVILRVTRSDGREAAEHFLGQAERLAGLGHPGLPEITGYGDTPEGLWVTSAVVEGTSLKTLIARNMPPRLAARLLGEVAEALDAAHAAGVVHGDIRPENVIVQGWPAERARLVAFKLDAAASTTLEPTAYTAPERLAGAAPAPPADVFALAATLRECLKTSPHALPAQLGPILAHGLDADPARRPAGAGKLVAEAIRALGPAAGRDDPRRAVEARAHAREHPKAQPKPHRRDRRLLGALAAAALVAAAGTAGYAVSGEPDAAKPAGPRAVSAGPVTTAVPPGFTRVRGAPESPTLEQAVSFARRAPAATVTVGMAADASAVLDPARAAIEADPDPPRPREVSLKRLTALRFDRMSGRAPSVLYVAPTTAGAVVVACGGTRAAAAQPCAAAARALRIRNAQGFDPSAGIAWKNRLAGLVQRFRRSRSTALRRLRRAATPAGQARAAGALAGVHTAMARLVRAGETPPQAVGVNRRVLARLASTAAGYRALARAARARSSARFRRAVRRVRRADRRLRATLRTI